MERANKDVTIEALLNTFEEVWLSRQLELRVYRRASDSSQQEAISDLTVDGASATPKSGALSARVTSGVRKSGGMAYPAILATPGGASVGHAPNVFLLRSTTGIFDTLESHQV